MNTRNEVVLAPPQPSVLFERLGLGDLGAGQVARVMGCWIDDWELLVGHGVVDGRELSGESVRAQYLHLTDRLVERVTSGSFDRVVFLDKSARPVCWLMRDAWPFLAHRFEDGRSVERHPLPRCTFLNIDRLQWREVMDPEGVGRFDVTRIPAAALNGLRDTFADEHGGTWLDGERVLVVDEVRVSGDTGTIATDILSEVFPDSAFWSHQWMTPKLVVRDRNRYNNQLPVWYRDDTHLGRGIGDRDPAWSLEHPNRRIRAGAWFLSRPLGCPDPLSQRLRLELRALVAELVRGGVPLVPAIERDDYDARCQLFNGVDAVTLRRYRESNALLFDL